VALPLLRASYPDHPGFRIVELGPTPVEAHAQTH
jgi:hypothetical protein